jgi:hypothetical protein
LLSRRFAACSSARAATDLVTAVAPDLRMILATRGLVSCGACDNAPAATDLVASVVPGLRSAPAACDAVCRPRPAMSTTFVAVTP